MGSFPGFTFEKSLKEMFSQIRRIVGRVHQVRKRKSGLGPFRLSSWCGVYLYDVDSDEQNIFAQR